MAQVPSPVLARPTPRFVQLERLEERNAPEAYAAVVVNQPFDIWWTRMRQEGDHRIVRSRHTARVLGLVSGYGGSKDERSFHLAVIKNPKASVAYWEGVAAYLDYMFVTVEARKALLAGEDEATRQWLGGARRMFPGLTQEQRPNGPVWVLTRAAWMKSIYSEGKWSQPRKDSE